MMEVPRSLRRDEELILSLQEAVLKEKQKNARLTNKLQEVSAMVHDLSQRVHRMEFGITQDGLGELNSFGIHNVK